MNATKLSYYSALLLLCSLLASCNSTKSNLIYSDDVYFENSEINSERHIGTGDNCVKNTLLHQELKHWIGAPYRYGGNSPAGTDCSGMVMTVYKKVYGKKLERSSSKIFTNNCIQIRKSELREGDLVFFSTSKNQNRINHVGIYLDSHKFVHASSSRGVIISSLDEEYYQRTYIVAGRVK